MEVLTVQRGGSRGILTTAAPSCGNSLSHTLFYQVKQYVLV